MREQSGDFYSTLEYEYEYSMNLVMYRHPNSIIAALVGGAFKGACACAVYTLIQKLCKHPYTLTKRIGEDMTCLPVG